MRPLAVRCGFHRKQHTFRHARTGFPDSLVRSTEALAKE